MIQWLIKTVAAYEYTYILTTVWEKSSASDFTVFKWVDKKYLEDLLLPASVHPMDTLLSHQAMGEVLWMAM